MGSLRAWLRRQRDADERVFRVRAVLALILLGLLVYLAAGDNPWQGGIAERLRDGDPLRPIDYAYTWGWWTAAGNALLVAMLLLGCPFWVRGRPAPVCQRLASPETPGRRLFLVVLGAAVLATGVLSAPRLSFSWWDDEQYTITRHIDGRYLHDDQGNPRFHRVRWRDTFWNDREANNHVAFSVLSRLSLASWRAVARPPGELANETAARLPAWIAGLGGVALTGLLAWRLGFAWAGALAAWLLAVHPWYLRYASEARGYGLVLLLLPLTWLLLVRVMHRGTWGRWAAYGAAQALLLYAHVGVLYCVVLTNLAALAGIALFHRDDLREQTTRFVAASLISGAVWAQLMVPNMIQIMDYLSGWQEAAGVPPLREVLSYVLLGVEYKTRDPQYVTWVTVAAQHGPLLPLCLGLMGGLAGVGLVRMLAQGGMSALLVPALAIPGPFLYAISLARGDRFYPWYVVFVLPGLALLVAVGLRALVEWIPRGRAALAAQALAMAALLAIFCVTTQTPRRAMRAGSIIPERESVLVTRPSFDPEAPENQAILTASFFQPPAYYDPLYRWITEPEGLTAVMAEADRRGVPLFVNIGRPHGARKEEPELWARVEDPSLFERVAVLHGLEKRGKRIVYRYLPASER